MSQRSNKFKHIFNEDNNINYSKLSNRKEVEDTLDIFYTIDVIQLLTFRN